MPFVGLSFAFNRTKPVVELK